MLLATASSLVVPYKIKNGNVVEAEVVDESEYDTVNSSWGYANPNGNIYVLNLNANGRNTNKKHKNKDKQHKMNLKKAKEKIVESLTKISLYKTNLQELNPTKNDDAILIRKLNLKIHKENEKIRKIERDFDLNASQFEPQPTSPPKPKTLGEKIKAGWNKFWTNVKNFFTKHIDTIASIATISCSVLMLIIKFIK